MAIECTYCEEKVNVKRGIYIKCTTCQDIKLCLECFSAGATIAEHESDHPYELIDCGSFPIIDESWKAHEELALLEAIELYGIGSWTDIANAVETRNAEECCERYLRVYVDNFFGRCSWNAIDKELYTVKDHTCKFNQPLSPSLSLPERHKIVDINKEQQIRLGYMPKRDDFEREYDNEGELLVSKLAVNANDDTDLDQDLKIAHINMYTDKLRERFRRKRIVLEYNLVKLFFHMHPEECGDQLQNNNIIATSTISSNPIMNSNLQLKLQDSQTSLANQPNNAVPSNNTAMLSNCNNTIDDVKDHNLQMTTSPTNPNVQANIDQPQQHSTANEKTTTTTTTSTTANNNHSVQNTILNYFRRIDPSTNGVTKNSSNHSENSILSSYFSDLNKSMAEQDFNTMEKKLRIFCQFSSAEEHNRLIRNLAREKELKVKIKELIKKRKIGLKYHNLTNNNLNNNINGNDSDASSKQCPSTNKKNPTKGILSTTEEPMDVDINETTTTSAAAIVTAQNTPTPTKVTHKKNKNESTKAIMNLHLNQNSEPNWRLLSESEKRLCKSLNLKPSQYMSFKAFIIKVSNHNNNNDG